MKKIIFLTFFIALLGLLILPLQSLALGQMSEPIVIENGMRGEEYEEELFIINNEDNIAKIDLVAEGDIKDWVKFYQPNDFENPIESTIIKALENGKIMAVFSIPEDTANGEYKGVVGVVRKPGETTSENEDSSGASVSQRIDREVTIKIGGEEEIGLTVSVIPYTYDLEKGKILSVRFIYHNQGNVRLKPQMQFRIKQNNENIYNAFFPYPEEEPAVKPGAHYEIPALEIPTSNLKQGKYTAEIDFLHNDKIILTEDFKFSVVNKGFVLGAINIDSKIFWPIVIVVFVFLIIIGRVFLQKRKQS